MDIKSNKAFLAALFLAASLMPAIALAQTTAGIDTTMNPQTNTPNPQVFGLGGSQVGVWDTSGLTVNSGTFTAPAITSKGTLTANTNIAIPGQQLGAFNASSSDTANALRDIGICATGQVLTKTGATSFACTTSAGSGTATNPPVCNASGQFLQYDGTNFQCVTMASAIAGNGAVGVIYRSSANPVASFRNVTTTINSFAVNVPSATEIHGELNVTFTGQWFGDGGTVNVKRSDGLNIISCGVGPSGPWDNTYATFGTSVTCAFDDVPPVGQNLTYNIIYNPGNGSGSDSIQTSGWNVYVTGTATTLAPTVYTAPTVPTYPRGYPYF